MSEYTLVIGDYAKSSWSMRAWLMLKAANIQFDTKQIKLEQADTRAAILEYSPSGKVPALIVAKNVINDSLAIAESMAEKFPDAALWPSDPALRAKARSAAAEMHAGFVNLRTQMSFGINTGDRIDAIWPDTASEIKRVFQIWEDLRSSDANGTFLCGKNFGIVDAMFVPVIFRFRRFGIEVPQALQSYVEAVLDYPPVKEWLVLAKAELRSA